MAPPHPRPPIEWAYRERIESAGSRYNVLALFADADAFAAVCDELCESFGAANVDRIASRRPETAGFARCGIYV